MKLLNRILILCMFFACIQPAFADDANKRLEQKIEPEKNKGVTEQITNRITLSGAVELDYSYADDKDTSDNTINGSTSDLDIGTVELGIEAALHKYVTATLLLKGEALDSDANVFWDEAFFEIKKEDVPLYLVGGKRAQPFGVFESLFINDPVTCELYEINDTGITIGFANETLLGFDLSFTLYKGETLITKVNDSGYGWSRDNTAGYTVSDAVNSFIISSSIEPVEGFALSIYFNSEPGDTDRNTTLGGAVHFEVANLILDGEYIQAIKRELHVTDNQEYNEKAWTVSLGYQIVDPLMVAGRYESFDADNETAGNLENRYSVGATYTLLEMDSFVCSLMGEYRKSSFETTASSSNDEENDEFFARIAIEF
ncbi:MAG: porin [Desulfobacteraceae bacterium]|nr:porin [Desulfobacteraceae bacterium]